MPNIPKLRLMLARMEKSASRWRTVQGLTALVGKHLVSDYPRLDVLQRAANMQGIKTTGEGFAKAMSSLPKGPAGVLGQAAPTQVFRGGSQPADLIRGGYSADYLHGTPFKHVAESYGDVKSSLPYRNPINLVGVYGTTKNQRYAPDYGFEPAQYSRGNMIDPTKGLTYPYRAWQESMKQKRLYPTIPPTMEQTNNLAYTSNMYETPVKPSQLQSVLLNDRVLPATAKGRELLQTGTMPAGAKLPPEILKSAAGVTKEELIHAYKANDPAMRILSQSPVLDKDFLYHASGKKFNALDPKYNSKRSYGHEYTEPVVFAGDAPSSAFASNPTAEYQAVKDKMKDSVYHRLIDELTGRKALLGHTPGGYLYKLPASAFTRIDREDNELGKWNKSTEYVSHRPVKPISVTPMQSTDVDAIPEYEYLGKDFVGEMPAQHYLKHAKNPKVIAAIQAWLANKQEKEAGIADIANRALSALIKSPVTPSFVKNTFYPGFPAVREALRATGRLKTIVPSTGVGDIPTFAVRGENSPAFKALKSQFKTMVPENQTPEGVFDKITTEMSGTPLQRTYSGFVAKNQAKADFKHEPWGEVYNAPMGHYRPRTNVAVNFVENNDTMRHELAHALQYQLPNNFNSLHTLSTGTKLPVIPRSGWTTVRGTRAPSGSSFLQEMNANAAMSRTPLGQMGRAIGYATDPERARAYASRYTPTEKLIHNTLSFPRDIPRRVKAMPGQLMDWIDSKILPPNLTKGAGVFTASGNKVQGVGLRKLYHSLLDERGLTGLGVNNEDTGDVELSFDGDEARRKEVFKELAARIRAKTNHPVTFAPTAVPQTSTPVKLSNKDSERLNAIHHLAYRMSNMYDPADSLMDPNDTFKQKLADRFRLQVNKGGLTGTVPSRAAEQLLGTRPMYAGMMPARRTRSEAEALSDMPMAQQQRLFKALKSGRGFLAPNEGGVSKLAGLLKQGVYWSNDVSRDLLNGRKYPLSYLTGELGELGESVKNMDWPNFKEELGDSAYAAQMILAQKLGLNLPLIGAAGPIDKFYARRKGWEEVFKERGIPFSNDYLAGGSNLKKPKKIQAALSMAGHSISQDEARALSLKHGGEIEDDWVDNSVSKLASAAVEAPMNLYSYIPSGSIEHVKKHGLLSGNELAKPENRHLLDIARPDGDADRWLKERDARLAKSPWTNSYNGPSAFFGDIDAGKIHDKHPIKKFNTTRAVIKLRELLRDYPTTKMEGSELIPFSDTTYDALDEKGQNEFVNKRHHTLSLDEIKALLTRGQNPKDMWKDFKDTEGKYYASDVPHAQVVTPMGKIPSKYIKFGETI